MGRRIAEESDRGLELNFGDFSPAAGFVVRGDAAGWDIARGWNESVVLFEVLERKGGT